MKITKAAVRLSQTHGHLWAGMASPAWLSNPWVDSERSAKAMQLMAQRANRHCVVPGLENPTNSHETRTGRISWEVIPRADNSDLVRITVSRPSTAVGGLSGGSIPVLRVEMGCEPTTGLCVGIHFPDPDFQSEECNLAEERHREAMEDCLVALGKEE